MEPIFLPAPLQKSRLDIETGRDSCHKMFSQLVTSTLTLYTFYLVGKGQRTMEEYLQMLKHTMALLHLLGSTG
jgi:hypothetical protein